MIEIMELKEAIIQLYESIRVEGFTPRLQKLVKQFRTEVEEYKEILQKLAEEQSQ